MKQKNKTLFLLFTISLSTLGLILSSTKVHAKDAMEESIYNFDGIQIDNKGTVLLNEKNWKRIGKQVNEELYERITSSKDHAGKIQVILSGKEVKEINTVYGSSNGSDRDMGVAEKLTIKDGAIERFTYCEETLGNCISLNKALCNQYISLLGFDNAADLKESETACRILNQKKMSFRKNVYDLSRSFGSDGVSDTKTLMKSFNMPFREASVDFFSKKEATESEIDIAISSICAGKFWAKGNQKVIGKNIPAKKITPGTVVPK